MVSVLQKIDMYLWLGCFRRSLNPLASAKVRKIPDMRQNVPQKVAKMVIFAVLRFFCIIAGVL